VHLLSKYGIGRISQKKSRLKWTTTCKEIILEKYGRCMEEFHSHLADGCKQNVMTSFENM
jgi:hypothetical protein